MEGHEPTTSQTDADTAENLKRLADFLNCGTPLSVRLNGRRVTLPDNAKLSIHLD